MRVPAVSSATCWAAGRETDRQVDKVFCSAGSHILGRACTLIMTSVLGRVLRRGSWNWGPGSMTIQLGDIKLSASMGPTYVYFRLVFYDPRALIHSHMQLLLPRLPMPKARDLIFKKKKCIYLGAPGLNWGIWDLVPWPGIKLRAWVLVTWPPAKSQGPFQLYGSSLSAWLFPAHMWPLPYRPSHVYTHQSHSFSKQIGLCLFPAYCFTWFPTAYGTLPRLACENLAPERSGAPPLFLFPKHLLEAPVLYTGM